MRICTHYHSFACFHWLAQGIEYNALELPVLGSNVPKQMESRKATLRL